MHESLAQSWLALQCRMIPDVAGAFAALGGDGGGDITPSACWPDRGAATPALLAVAREALASNQLVVRAAGDAGAVGIAAPLFRSGRPLGVVALAVPRRSDGQLTAVTQLVQWGSAWLELLLGEQALGSDAAALTRQLTELCLKHEPFEVAATAVVTALAERFRCDRVGLGLVRRGRVKLDALSYSASFDARATLIGDIEAVLAESIAAGRVLGIPPLTPVAPEECQAHERLAHGENGEAVCSLPLRHGADTVAALVLERSAERPFEAAEIETLETVAEQLGPLLKLRFEHDRPLLSRAAGRLSRRLRQLSRPAAGVRAVAGLTLAGALLVLAFGTAEFRVRAPVTLEGAVQRAAVAPWDGYVAAAHVHAGATVRAGQVLAELDDVDLRLERRDRTSERDKLERQYRKALADLDQSAARILRAEVEQANARLALLDEHLARATITAPFDGVVIAGDLSRSLGAPVERGDVLFEVAPLDGYRVVLQVDERDLPELTVGQHGRLTLSALPGERLDFVIENIATVMAETDGRTAFRVEAKLQQPALMLRPGMQGVGKIDVDRRNRVWIWTRRLSAWLQLAAWSVLP